MHAAVLLLLAAGYLVLFLVALALVTNTFPRFSTSNHRIAGWILLTILITLFLVCAVMEGSGSLIGRQ